ncbi:hypothetical protein KR009_001552, partial [Drosophila setifemur]
PPLKMNQNNQKVNFGRRVRMQPLIEPVSPLAQLSGPRFRARRAVVEYYQGAQSNPDDAMLPMPPHNKILTMVEVLQIMQRQLASSKNFWSRALQLIRQRF